MQKPIITIDGPAASGKGAICKLISKDLRLFYLETGLYYRSFAYLMIKNRNKKLNISDFINSIDHDDFKNSFKDKEKLYSNEITNISSEYASLENVRKFIVSMQKVSIKEFNEDLNGIILEGRDCGTVISPEADIKIFLTADIEIRAKRRFSQFNKARGNVKYKDVLKNLTERDIRDKNRKHSPLKKAKDAILINNSHYSIDQTINIVKNIIFSKIPSLKNKI